MSSSGSAPLYPYFSEVGNLAFIVSIAPWLEWVALILGVAASFYASLRFVHMLQLESYQANMYLKWLGKKRLEGLAAYRAGVFDLYAAGRGADLCDTLSGLRPLPGDLCARTVRCASALRGAHAAHRRDLAQAAREEASGLYGKGQEALRGAGSAHVSAGIVSLSL